MEPERNPNPDPLDPMLDRWSALPDPDPGLGREVERRIAAERSVPAARRSTLPDLLVQPAFAGLFVFSCVVTGLFLAEVRVAKIQAETSSRLARSYVELINPLLRDPVKEAATHD